VNWIFLLGAMVVTASWLGYRRRLARVRGPVLTDEQIRAIEERGTLRLDEMDEPLDLHDAQEEEERFWDESWDEPEPL
jgi:hypothetical protein